MVREGLEPATVRFHQVRRPDYSVTFLILSRDSFQSSDRGCRFSISNWFKFVLSYLAFKEIFRNRFKQSFVLPTWFWLVCLNCSRHYQSFCGKQEIETGLTNLVCNILRLHLKYRSIIFALIICDYYLLINRDGKMPNRDLTVLTKR